MTWEGKASPRTRLLDAPLVLEVWDAGAAVCGSDRGVDVVLNAFAPRHFGEPLALLLFAGDAGLPGVLDREHTPGSVESAIERGAVVQVARHHLGALRGQGPRRLAVGFAGQGPNAATRGEKLPSDAPPCLPVAPVMTTRSRLRSMARTLGRTRRLSSLRPGRGRAITKG